MTNRKGFKKRFFEATLEYGRVEGEMWTPEILGEKVAKEMHGKKKDKPFSASSVSRWKSGVIPNVVTVAAMARVLHVDPGWLAFGEFSKAPRPGASSSDVDPDVGRIADEIHKTVPVKTRRGKEKKEPG